ncbi:hypothetical protein TNCV_2945821 [Trichonephila clavipes]|nr:hypothetical protein TNCV_2945821 [Trichonephila clavipes]
MIDCGLQTITIQSRSVTPDITPHSFVKDHNTEELVGWYGVWNQLRWTSAYYSEWHFDGPKVCRRDTSTSCQYAGAIGDSFVFQDDNARPHRDRLVENMLEAETIQRMEWTACDLNQSSMFGTC